MAKYNLFKGEVYHMFFTKQKNPIISQVEIHSQFKGDKIFFSRNIYANSKKPIKEIYVKDLNKIFSNVNKGFRNGPRIRFTELHDSDLYNLAVGLTSKIRGKHKNHPILNELLASKIIKEEFDIKSAIYKSLDSRKLDIPEMSYKELKEEGLDSGWMTDNYN